MNLYAKQKPSNTYVQHGAWSEWGLGTVVIEVPNKMNSRGI
jgi:hypothetical protein